VALEDLGVTLRNVQGAIKRPDAPEIDDSSRRLPISPQGRAALEQSLNEAVARGDGHLGVEHVLLALIRDERSDAARTLSRLGASPRQVEAALSRGAAKQGRNVRAGA